MGDFEKKIFKMKEKSVDRSNDRRQFTVRKRGYKGRREKAIGLSPDSGNVLAGLRSKTSELNQNKTNAASLICYQKLSKQN